MEVGTAIVVAPAPNGVGGLGAAAGQMAAGLEAHGLVVRYLDFDGRATSAQRLLRTRAGRRLATLSRVVDRRVLRSRIDSDWSLAYAIPGYLPRHATRRQVRVLHAASHHPRVALESIAAARRRAGGGRGFVTRFDVGALERELRLADVLRAECEAVASELRGDEMVRGRVIVASPGVDLKRFSPGRKADELTVAFVGTFSLWKGLDILVELERRISGDAVLATVGGPVCPWSRRLAQTATFQGHCDVPKLLARAHALVLPSATDGFGYVVLEAMAAGAVPFCTPEVGAAELVRRISPELVQPAAQFADAVAEMLRSLPLDELGRRARGIAEEFDGIKMRVAAAGKVISAARDL